MADYKKIYLFPGGGIPQHTELVHRDYDRYKYFFRISAPNNYYQAKCHGAMLESVVATLKKELGIDRPKMAILGEKAAWADTYAKTAREMASILGVEIVGEWRPSATANDLTAELTAIKKSGAHIIFEAFSGPVGVIFGKQLGELKIPVSTLGLNIEGSQFKYWKSTNGMCEYETTLNSIVRANITKKTIPFFDKFVQKTGEYPLYSATGGYDGVYLFKEASERAGTLKSDKVVNELEKVKYAGAAGTIAFYPKSHKWTHDLVFGPGYSTTYGTQWIDGKLITVWPDGKRIDPKLEMGDGWEKFKIRGISKLKLSPYMIKYWKNK